MRNRIIIVGLVVLAVGFAVGSAFLYRSEAFSVKRVVVSGNDRLTKDRVIRIAGLPPGTTLLRLPVDEMQARLKADPWILDASIERVFPNQVRILVTERRPVAAIDLGPKGLWVLDATGTLIATSTAAAKPSLPLVREVPVVRAPRPGLSATSQQLKNAVKVVGGIGPSLRGMVKFVDARTVDETTLFTAQGIEILIGLATQMDKKDFLARRILADQKGKVVFIDVRSVDRPVWRGLGK